MGIFLCVCVFLIQKIGIFLILHYSFSFSKLFNHFTGFFKGIFTEVFHQDFFLFQFQFVSFIHAAFRIWKNNSFTTELCIAEAFKYRAVDKRIFSYLNLPYCLIFTLFFLRKWKKFLYFLVITGYIFCLISFFFRQFLKKYD